MRLVGNPYRYHRSHWGDHVGFTTRILQVNLPLRAIMTATLLVLPFVCFGDNDVVLLCRIYYYILSKKAILIKCVIEHVICATTMKAPSH